jgi:hypothetical protein
MTTIISFCLRLCKWHQSLSIAVVWSPYVQVTGYWSFKCQRKLASNKQRCIDYGRNIQSRPKPTCWLKNEIMWKYRKSPRNETICTMWCSTLKLSELTAWAPLFTLQMSQGQSTSFNIFRILLGSHCLSRLWFSNISWCHTYRTIKRVPHFPLNKRELRHISIQREVYACLEAMFSNK